MNKSFFKLLIPLTISLLLLAFVLRHFGLENTLEVIQTARHDYLVLAFLFLVTAYLLRGYRWLIWEGELKYWDSFKLILIGFMGNNLLPARLGEFLRAHCTSEKTGDNFGRTAALASVTIERVLDGLILSWIGILGLLFVPVSKGLFYSLLFVTLFFAVLTSGLIIGIHFHAHIRQGLDKVHEIFPGHLTRFGKEKVNYFLDGLLLIQGIDKLAKAILLTAVIWGLEIVCYFLIANSMSSGISLQTCLIFLATVNFASLFPFTVGGIGAIEGAATVFLMDTGIPGNQALAMVVIQHAMQFGFTTSLGGIFYFIDGYYRTPLRRTGTANKVISRSDDISRDVVNDTHNKVLELSEKYKFEKNLQKDVRLSIVIPGYNEQSRLPKTVLQTITWCATKGMEYELILVDDGSEDNTPLIVQLFASNVKDIRYILCPHLGKGATVRMGMLNAVGKYVLFMDADGATPLDEIPKLMKEIDGGYDIAIGSRVSQNPEDTMVITSWHRKIIGRTFAVLVNLFAIPGFADTQCGFKMFRHEVVRDIFSRQELNGFAFDVEILFVARKLGCPIIEVPINWVNQEGSKVNIVVDSIKMLYDIMRIKWIHKNGDWQSSNKFYISIEN